MILSTGSYKVPEDKETWKWWFGIWTIRITGGSAFQEIVGMSKATASLPVEQIEWTLFRCDLIKTLIIWLYLAYSSHRVPALTNGEAKLVRTSFLGDGSDGMFLSRKSLAVWVLQELLQKQWVGKAPSLSNPGWM